MLTALKWDYEEATPEAHVLASQIAYAGKKKNRALPKKTADLAASITDVSITLSQKQSPNIVLTIQDPRWHLLDSGFFDADPTGKLLDIDIQYPDASGQFWRLHQFSPQANHTIQLTFIPRVVAELMGLFGPIQVDRASRTRAQFLKMLCGKVNDPAGAVQFYSKELDVKQPIGTVSTVSKRSSSKAPKGKHAKTKGLGANTAALTVKGQPMNSTQHDNASLIMQVGDNLNAPDAALQACCFAAIYESNFGTNTTWNPTYGGLLAGNVGSFGHYGAHSSQAVATAEITSFFQGGNGYQAGGAIAASHKNQDPAWIASQVEAATPFDSRGYSTQYLSEGFPFDRAVAEAKAIVQAGGGSGGGAVSAGSTTVKVAQPYYFQVQQNEDYWSGMCRLAQEVGWELIADSAGRIYYDQDTVLITQKVAAVIDRDDPTTLDWGYDWENRHIATNFRLQLAADAFEFQAGEVIQVRNFGVAAQASTAKPPLPGRWLIDDVTRRKGDLYSELSLVQPLPPKPEPEPQYTTETTTVTPGGGVSVAGGAVKIPGSIQDYPAGSAEAAYAAGQYLASLKLSYTQANRTLNRTYPQGSTNLDCSASVSWVLLAAGFPLPGNVTWGGWAPVSGDFFGGGAGGALQSGPGKNLTIYYNAGHVFIRIHPDGYSDMQGNTVSPLVHMRGFDFFPWTAAGCGKDGGPSPSGFSMSHYQGV
jgi:hypothetical protein